MVMGKTGRLAGVQLGADAGSLNFDSPTGAANEGLIREAPFVEKKAGVSAWRANFPEKTVGLRHFMDDFLQGLQERLRRASCRAMAA